MSEKHEVHIRTSFNNFAQVLPCFWTSRLCGVACLVQFLWSMSLFLELLCLLCIMGKYGLIWPSLEKLLKIFLEKSLNFNLIKLYKPCYHKIPLDTRLNTEHVMLLFRSSQHWADPLQLPGGGWFCAVVQWSACNCKSSKCFLLSSSWPCV